EEFKGLLDTEEFCCSICLDLLKDPVAIPCGHSYCIECINDYWKKNDHLRVFSCPQCGQTFSSRPVLNRNTMLADMVDKLKKLELLGNCQIYDNCVPGDVTCDFCTSIKQKAVMSCLVCLASYCQNHLQAHYKSPALKKHKLIEASSSAQTAMENGEQIFTELMQSIERRRCKFRDLIRDQERAAESMLQTLEQEITELKQRDHELEMLLKSEDHVHVLQVSPIPVLTNCHSFSSGLPDPPFTIATLSDFGKVNEAISALKKKLEDVFKGEWLRIYQILHCTVPKIRSEFLYHSCPLQLNPLTAHKDLSLSKGNREMTIRSRVQSCPDHPERFDYWCQVLGTEGLTGCSYWEVEWSGMGVNIAVAYKNIARKGESSEAHFGHNDKSWSLFCCRKGYAFWHNRIVSKISEPGSSKIGVYLDHRAGTLAFYSIDDSMTLLHRVHTTFTQPLYPGFEFSCYDASIELCQLE
uniref:Tripartite motif-containing protein 16-like n=1 Tax=Sinocyclocheilus rhinocerous TaxID=307959 RepID=A0A673LLP6_9TELE